MSDQPAPVRARIVPWEEHADELVRLRTEVFVDEQGVPPELEIDGRDPEAIHVAARTEDGTLVGTGRLLAGGRIGRMAVARPWRGRGVGSTLLATLLAEAARRGLEPRLSAQADAVPFYERHGFVAEGEVYEEAGIPHRRMRFAPEDG